MATTIEIQNDYVAEEVGGDKAVAKVLTLLRSINVSSTADIWPINAGRKTKDGLMVSKTATLLALSIFKSVYK